MGAASDPQLDRPPVTATGQFNWLSASTPR